MPIKTAAIQTSSIYGNITLSKLNINQVSGESSTNCKTTLTPSNTTATIAPEAIKRPHKTAFAAFHALSSPSSSSLFLKIGMNAPVNAPSPSKRRNRLGI